MNSTTPAWTHEEGIAFECAREVITDVMGILSSEIAREVDPQIAESKRKQRSALFQEREALRVSDQKTIARVRQVYGKTVRKHLNSFCDS
jgi:hypothetical protein